MFMTVVVCRMPFTEQSKFVCPAVTDHSATNQLKLLRVKNYSVRNSTSLVPFSLSGARKALLGYDTGAL
jgi:hypothetical protein